MQHFIVTWDTQAGHYGRMFSSVEALNAFLLTAPSGCHLHTQHETKRVNIPM